MHKVYLYQSTRHFVYTYIIKALVASLSHLLNFRILCLQLCAPATVPTLSASTSRLITYSKPFHPASYLPLCVLDSAFADIVHVYKFHLLTYLLICFFLLWHSESKLDAYTLHIMEDDGEIDADFPPLESQEPVSKFGFDQLGLVVNDLSVQSGTACKMTPVTV